MACLGFDKPRPSNRALNSVIPQLRVRTEYSYKTAYGSPDLVAQRLAEQGQLVAGIVDTAGTWGHVAWEKAAKTHDLDPLYGTELTVADEKTGLNPRCWVLAEDLATFYRLSSANPETEAALAEASSGVIRFAGAALSDPQSFDYIDINPRSARATQRALSLHERTGKPLVLTSDNDYPTEAERLKFLAWDDSLKMTPQHLLSDQEFESAFSFLGKTDYKRAVRSTQEAAERASGLQLRQAPIIHVEGDLWAEVEQGIKYRLDRGHIPDWTEEYEARVKREVELILQKRYESYFFVVADMILWAKERMLVGPARGSSAGSLVCFLLRITEVDPLVHGLIFERFIDVNRDDLPDIDVDFNDQKRELVFDYLGDKYGSENVARIGSVSRLKPRSVMAHVGKKLGVPHGATFAVLNVLIEYSSGDARYGKGLEDTIENTRPGQEFLKLYPEAALMGELENHASHTGQHAAGIIVSNAPVTEYCTVRNGIAHIDKKDAEYLNLLKIDALGLRTLGVIEDTGCITPEELYDLPFDDPKVLDVFNQHKFSGIFQFEGAAQRRVSVQVPVEEFRQIDHLTALARPGPLGGGAANTYINRNAGREAVEYRHESMSDYLSDTMGVVLYQEQVMKIVREIGDFSWEDTSTIRKAMSGRKGEEFFNLHGKNFIKGAAKLGIDEDDARVIWEEICSFGAWGMNKSHTVSYAMISYWCAHMKAYHPLEYAAACLRNAKDDDQTIEILRELSAEGVPFVPFDAQLSQANWSATGDSLLGGYTNLVGIGPKKAANYIQKRDSEKGGLTEKDFLSLSKLQPKHNDLTPAHTLWGHLYDDPDLVNVHGPIKQFTELEDRENAVVICKLIRQERRDENEAVRANRRGHKLDGQTLFLDTFMVDDSVSKPVLARIKCKQWHLWGEKMADRAVSGQDWFLIRGRWLSQFSMMSITKIKCLTNEELFW